MYEVKGYVNTQYLHAAAKLLAPIKHRSYEYMHLQPGQTVLDVGCGPGIDTTALAQIVGETGYVVGIDQDIEMLSRADQVVKETGLNTYVEHLRGDATSLAFDSEQFDACRSERLFIHLLHPERAINEMVRVTKPGGWITILDTDWGTLSIDTSEIKVERQLARFRAEKLLNNGYSGRSLYRLLGEQHLQDITLKIFPIYLNDLALVRYLTRLDEVEDKALAQNFITQLELNRWHSNLEQTDNAKHFFASLNMVLVAARKP
jgi:ubiquinone/menaquinone biosynthesis C-methylase UbiE